MTMTPRVSVVTPTCDRPVGMRLLVEWMARQTRKPDEWIVADGSRHPIQTMPPGSGSLVTKHLAITSKGPGVENFLNNLDRGIRAATGDLIIIMEDDDYYAPAHIETIVAQLSPPEKQIAGDNLQRYYNLAQRCYRTMHNRGASLCQTAFTRDLVPTFLQVIGERRDRITSPNPNERRRAIGVDFYFWHAVPREHWALTHTGTVVGMKGLPGLAGLGMGHRPAGGWSSDPNLTVLKQLVGPDAAALYAELAPALASE